MCEKRPKPKSYYYPSWWIWKDEDEPPAPSNHSRPLLSLPTARQLVWKGLAFKLLKAAALGEGTPTQATGELSALGLLVSLYLFSSAPHPSRAFVLPRQEPTDSNFCKQRGRQLSFQGNWRNSTQTQNLKGKNLKTMYFLLIPQATLYPKLTTYPCTPIHNSLNCPWRFSYWFLTFFPQIHAFL